MGIKEKNGVFEETLKYFKGDSLATDVWMNKYALKDSDGMVYELTPDDMHRRLGILYIQYQLFLRLIYSI